MDIFSTELNSSPSNINSQLEKEKKKPIRHWNVQELVGARNDRYSITSTLSQLQYHKMSLFEIKVIAEWLVYNSPHTALPQYMITI